MVKYICDYCGKEFCNSGEYIDHQNDCIKSPYQKSNMITLHCYKVTYHLGTGRYNLDNEDKNVFDMNTHYEELQYCDGERTQGRTIQKSKMNKVLVSASLHDMIIVKYYYTISDILFPDIKQLFIEAIKNEIQEKIDRLNQVKNNVML
jgi:hypothetical protein